MVTDTVPGSPGGPPLGIGRSRLGRSAVAQLAPASATSDRLRIGPLGLCDLSGSERPERIALCDLNDTQHAGTGHSAT